MLTTLARQLSIIMVGDYVVVHSLGQVGFTTAKCIMKESQKHNDCHIRYPSSSDVAYKKIKSSMPSEGMLHVH